MYHPLAIYSNLREYPSNFHSIFPSLIQSSTFIKRQTNTKKTGPLKITHRIINIRKKRDAQPLEILCSSLVEYHWSLVRIDRG